jgi:hypothetical protein
MEYHDQQIRQILLTGGFLESILAHLRSMHLFISSIRSAAAKDIHKQLFGPKPSSNMRPLGLVAAMNAFGSLCI